MLKKIIGVLLIICMSHLGWTQNFDTIQLNRYLNHLEENNKFMGSIAVSKNGSVIYSKTIGFLDVGHQIKANDSSKYRIGSISKTFTAVLIFKAIEEKKLNLNETIVKWFPTIKDAKKITIENLLNHRSGIHNFTENADYLTWNTRVKTEREMVSIIAKGGSEFSPGSRSMYSNSNYLLLSYILEKVYHQTYPELLQELIIQPIGLKNTSIFDAIRTQDNECKSYRFSGKWEEEPETHFSISLGAGAILSTATDLTKFADALMNGRLLNLESLERMKKLKDNVGMGLFPIPFYDKNGYGHTGAIDGFSSVFAFFPNDNISYALVSNATNFDNNEISIAVLSAVFGKPFEIPEFHTIDLVAEELEGFLGVYASPQIPLKITISKNGNTLIAQGTGQPSFALEAIDKNKFKSDQVGVKLEFDEKNSTMTLFQGGAQIQFAKE